LYCQHTDCTTVVNKLSLSIDKTCYSVFGSRNHNYSVDSVINLNDNVLTEVDKCKYLGLMIDNKLTWRQHIDHTVCTPNC